MVEPKTFWLINQYASTPETGMGGRHYYMARELAKQGHDVFLISGSYGHKLRERKNQKELLTQTKVEGFSHVKLKTLTYLDSFSKKRVFNWFIFSFLLGFYVRRKLPEPDAIVYSSPALIGYLGARRLARKLNVPLTFEVRGIWPLTLVHLGGYSPAHPFIRFMQWVEDKAYREADHVVSNLKNAVEHMQARGMNPDKFTWIPNGFCLDEVSRPEPLPEDVYRQLPKGKFLVGYTGALGVANALDTLVDTAEILKKHNDIAFVLVGGGKEKTRLQSIAAKKDLNNVIFIDPIPKVQIQSMLHKFDVCFIGWRNEGLYQFGIGANKFWDYFYSSKPVLHAYSGLGDPVKEYGAGLTVPAEKPTATAEAILLLKSLSSVERDAMGTSGYNHVNDKHEYGVLAQKLVFIALGEVSNES
jgi:glycosyltransferase involved in cell wall biosynthesis